MHHDMEPLRKPQRMYHEKLRNIYKVCSWCKHQASRNRRDTEFGCLRLQYNAPCYSHVSRSARVLEPTQVQPFLADKYPEERKFIFRIGNWRQLQHPPAYLLCVFFRAASESVLSCSHSLLLPSPFFFRFAMRVAVAPSPSLLRLHLQRVPLAGPAQQRCLSRLAQVQSLRVAHARPLQSSRKCAQRLHTRRAVSTTSVWPAAFVAGQRRSMSTVKHSQYPL